MSAGTRTPLVGTRTTSSNSINIRVYAPGSNFGNISFDWTDPGSGTRRTSTVTGYYDRVVAAVQTWRDMPATLRVVSDTANSELLPQTAGVQIFLVNQPYPRPVTVTHRTADILGVTSLAVVPRRVEVYLPEIAVAASADFDYLRNNQIIAANYTLEQVILLYLHFTVVHELGHAFALDHPDDPTDSGSSSAQLMPPLQGRRELVGANQYADVLFGERPSIMTARTSEWLREMRSMLQGPVAVSDIRPSPRDIRGAGSILNPPPPPVSAPAPAPQSSHSFSHWGAGSVFLYFLTLGNYSPDVAP